MRIWKVSGLFVTHDDKKCEFGYEVLARDGDSIEPVNALKKFLSEDIKGGFTVESIERCDEIVVISGELVEELNDEYGRDVEG